MKPPSFEMLICESRRSLIEALEVIPMENGTFVLFPFYKIGEYSEGCIPEYNCAGYAKRLAREIFGVTYEKGNAWDLGYIYNTIRVKNLRDQFDSGELEPGDLLGISNKNSMISEEERDMYGRKPRYTHVSCFLGKDIWANLRLGEQIGSLRRASTLRQMKIEGLTPLEIIKKTKREKKKKINHKINFSI